MAVAKRKTSAGKSKFYHYRFMLNGKSYSGACKGCTTKAVAEKFEKRICEKIIELSRQKNVKALIENFRDEMTGGSPVSIEDAFELSLKKPRKRQPSPELIKVKRSYWRDFLEFMKAHYSEIVKIADVRKKHAEEYIQLLRKTGRYCKEVEFKVGRKKSVYHRKGRLSNKSCNTFQQTISEVFEKLFDDAGLIENPFATIPKLHNDCESREAFTEKELKLIAEKADCFIKPIFVIGIATALREGDICTLKWSEIDFTTNIIRRKMSKTRRIVEIPILPPLQAALLEYNAKSADSEYVLPEHAKMYQNNSTGISMRVKKFLESLNIKTQKKVEGRDRLVSIKDVHSLRHTFCYYAGLYGIPFLIVKDIVGHVSPQMTELYQRHADNRVKREKLMQMPDFMGLSTKLKQPLLEVEPERKQLKELADSADIEKIIKAIDLLTSYCNILQ